VNKQNFISTLLLTLMFLFGAFAFFYGYPSFVENTYQYEVNGVTYEVHEFPWIKNSIYNYAIGLFVMLVSVIFAIVHWQAKHDSYETIIYMYGRR